MLNRLSRALTPVVLVLLVATAGCSSGASKRASSAIGSPTTAPRKKGGGAMPCDVDTFLQIVKREGAPFDLSPDVLSRTEPFGDPKCDPDFATQSFFFSPPSPEGYLAGFRPSADGSWVLISVNCKEIVDGVKRQIC
ncbi:MAG: hypothetical protein M3137_14725 [Actinomycetota bacterium]|nr:hypothetical protein [Actinomycetota bacterium]